MMGHIKYTSLLNLQLVHSKIISTFFFTIFQVLMFLLLHELTSIKDFVNHRQNTFNYIILHTNSLKYV